MKPRFLIQVAMSLLLTAVLASAQAQMERRHHGQAGPSANNPPDPQKMLQGRVDRLANQLNLTEAQKSQAAKIFGSSAQTVQTLRQQLHGTRKSLQAAVKANDPGQIDQLSNALGALTAQFTAIESKTEAQFNAILTPDQQARHSQRSFRPIGRPQAGRRGPPVQQ